MVDRGQGEAERSPTIERAVRTDFEPVMLGADDPSSSCSRRARPGTQRRALSPRACCWRSASYMIDAIDLQPEDRYWNIADPGWAYGMLYAVIGSARCSAMRRRCSRGRSPSNPRCASSRRGDRQPGRGADRLSRDDGGGRPAMARSPASSGSRAAPESRSIRKSCAGPNACSVVR